LVVFAVFSGPAAWASGSKDTVEQAESGFLSRLNQERTSRGLKALDTSGDLASLARRHSGDMASAGHPYHDPNIRAEVSNWQELGDNVGSGPNVDNIHTAFMNSQVHRDEILEPDYTQVGVGCFWAGDVLYVTEIFRLPMNQAHAAAPAAPAPTKTVTRTVRPAPAPAAPRAAPAAPAPTAPPTTATPATTPEPVATTAAPRVQPPAWPPATQLATRRVSHTSPVGKQLTVGAAVAALLFMCVAAFEVQALRRST
jgi:hypothetical protein